MNVQCSVVRQLVVALFLCLAGCRSKPGTSILGTTVNGRQIRAEISGGAFISSNDNEAIITTPAHRIVVHSDHLTLDGAELAKIPAESKKVDVVLKDGLLTIMREGTIVSTKTLGN